MGCRSSNDYTNKYGQLKHNVEDGIESNDGMIDKLVIGYIRNSIEEALCNDIETLCIHFFGTYGVDGHLIVGQGGIVTLHKSMWQFSSILIKEGGILKCNQYKPLFITCFGNITLEENGKIDLDGMGYSGGKRWYNGESYKGNSTMCCCANYGGGGGSINFDGAGGGYGGYGACNAWCYCCCICCIGWRGCKYGDKQLSVLHLGSGGGGGSGPMEAATGGNGGGAIRLQCLGTVILKENARITCNGGSGTSWCGGGSGGSIHMIINEKNNLQMNENSKISAEGGRGDKSAGNGGVGRIRIQFMKGNKNKILIEEHNNIRPEPYIG